MTKCSSIQMERQGHDEGGRLLAGIPVRRALPIEALVIVRRGRFTPADVGIVLALRRHYRLVIWVLRADAGRLLRGCVRRHAAIIPGAADDPGRGVRE